MQHSDESSGFREAIRPAAHHEEIKHLNRNLQARYTPSRPDGHPFVLSQCDKYRSVMVDGARIFPPPAGFVPDRAKMLFMGANFAMV
jgi:hypothetical protein